ncbi:hypothetical protein ACQJBY_038492 [Aegilops geniculata]
MAPDEDHEQGNMSGHNISNKSLQRCEGCDAHCCWCHMDDTQKYFFKCMAGNFKEEMASRRASIPYLSFGLNAILARMIILLFAWPYHRGLWRISKVGSMKLSSYKLLSCSSDHRLAVILIYDSEF